ncbi:hypothetical protein BDR06DRAFT_973583 [Suillus hirtellus]|nr:hypothetical protein BDR06DRAFT_973583 [Suillus hirtellus]
MGMQPYDYGSHSHKKVKENETMTEKELINIYLGKIVAQAKSLFYYVTVERYIHLHNLELKKKDNLSDSTHKAFMMALITQIFDSNQQWTYFLHRQVYTTDSIILLLFENLTLEETHLEIWYGSKYLLFHNMDMRAEIKTMMPLILSESTAEAHYVIDRVVEGCLLDSHKGVSHFSAKLYASWQAVYHNTVLASLANPLHKKSLQLILLLFLLMQFWTFML